MNILAASEGFSFADPLTLLIFFSGVALLLAVAILSKQSEWGIPTAGAYLLFGVAAALSLSLLDIPAINPLESSALLERLTEAAILVALFSGALKIKRVFSLRGWRTPLLLILVVMPLTILGVALFANIVIGLSLGAAILLGAILAPTDPVLAGEIGVEEVGDGEDEEHRFALSAEAGLNDGFAFPFVFLGIFLALKAKGGWIFEWLAADVFYAVAVGILFGLLLGMFLGRIVDFLDQKGYMSDNHEGFVAIAAILIIYGFVEWLGAYGFLAVFAGGLAYRRRPARTLRHYRQIHKGAEALERVCELALMVLIGSMLTVSGLITPGLWGWVLILLLLFLIRPLSVFLAFLGSRLNLKEKVFIAWFGIRGLGSLYYAAVAIESEALSKGEMNLVLWITLAAIVTSVVLHGLTAEPLTKKLHLHQDLSRGSGPDK